MTQRHTPIKKRSQSAYNNKVKKITDWYNKLIIYREKHPEVINVNTHKEVSRKSIKSLEEYISQIKKPNEN